MLASPSLTMRWSSTSKIRITLLSFYRITGCLCQIVPCQRNHSDNLCPGFRRTEKLQSALEQLQAFMHADNAEATTLATRTDCRWIKAYPIIGNRKAQFVVLDAEFYIDMLCVPMPAGIAQRFLRNAIAGQFQCRR